MLGVRRVPGFTSGAPRSAPVTPDLTRGSSLAGLVHPDRCPNAECGATFWKRNIQFRRVSPNAALWNAVMRYLLLAIRCKFADPADSLASAVIGRTTWAP